MRQLIAFTKKELMEQLRTGKLLLFAIVFCLFGVMNPAIAKLTPWMMELMSEQLAESGMIVSAMEVNDLTSWIQFFKNMPMALIVFLVLFSGILTSEYQKGTLINVVTKGMIRWRIFISKMGVMMVVWTLGCLVSYGITFAYNAFFWDNSAAYHVFSAVVCFYLLGLWLISVLGMASVFVNSSGAVILLVGTAYVISYLLAMFPAVKEYLPVSLMDSAAMLAGTKDIGDYAAAVVVTVVLIVVQTIISVIAFNKKNL